MLSVILCLFGLAGAAILRMMIINHNKVANSYNRVGPPLAPEYFDQYLIEQGYINVPQPTVTNNTYDYYVDPPGSLTEEYLKREMEETQARHRFRRVLRKEEDPEWDPILQQRRSPRMPKLVTPKYEPPRTEVIVIYEPAPPSPAPTVQPQFTQAQLLEGVQRPADAQPQFTQAQLLEGVQRLADAKNLLFSKIFAINMNKSNATQLTFHCEKLLELLQDFLTDLRFLAPLFQGKLDTFRAELGWNFESLVKLHEWFKQQNKDWPASIQTLHSRIEEICQLMDVQGTPLPTNTTTSTGIYASKGANFSIKIGNHTFSRDTKADSSSGQQGSTGQKNYRDSYRGGDDMMT